MSGSEDLGEGTELGSTILARGHHGSHVKSAFTGRRVFQKESSKTSLLSLLLPSIERLLALF